MQNKGWHNSTLLQEKLLAKLGIKENFYTGYLANAVRQARGKKRHMYLKRKKVPLFSDDIIIYIEKSQREMH